MVWACLGLKCFIFFLIHLFIQCCLALIERPMLIEMEVTAGVSRLHKSAPLKRQERQE